MFVSHLDIFVYEVAVCFYLIKTYLSLSPSLPAFLSLLPSLPLSLLELHGFGMGLVFSGTNQALSLGVPSGQCCPSFLCLRLPWNLYCD